MTPPFATSAFRDQDRHRAAGVPFSLVGAFWTLYLLHYILSMAVWVGIIALAGLDAETGVIMLLYLDLAYEEWKQKDLVRNAGDLLDAIYHGAAKRLRPKVMTACVIIAGLAPMVGGVITSTISVLVVYPAIFYLWRSRGLPKSKNGECLVQLDHGE